MDQPRADLGISIVTAKDTLKPRLLAAAEQQGSRSSRPDTRGIHDLKSRPHTKVPSLQQVTGKC